MTQPWQGSESQAIECTFLICRQSSANNVRNGDPMAKALFQEGLIRERSSTSLPFGELRYFSFLLKIECPGPSQALVLSRVETQS